MYEERKHLLKKSVVILLVILLFTGCSNVTGRDALFNQMDQLELALDQLDWEQIQIHATDLKDTFGKTKWKLQLIGDEGEYEGLNETIQKLLAAVKEEDSTNVRMELASTRSLISDIYSL